jgi:adenosylcobinamide-phosphate synthase
MKVYQALQMGDEEQARSAVSMIVGRDTDRLDEDGIIKAAVETVAENTADGVIAPMFYLAIGGGLLGVLYKSINTMDSMVGYKNERYLDFGRYAAKLDDIANYIPSRLAALLMIAGTGLCRLMECVRMTYNSARGEHREVIYNPGNAWRIHRRDRRKHASPNSAQTESVCAGALGIRLAGDAWYFGQKVEKPYIGDDLRRIEAEDIRRANILLYATSFLMWGLCVGVCAILRLMFF